MSIIVNPPSVVTVTVGAVQGPPGPPGSGITDPDALHISQHLSEFATPAQKQAARASLELDNIDGGTFN